MDKKFSQNLQLVAFGVILFVVLSNYQAVLNVVMTIWNMFLPVTTGLVMALVLNVPTTKISYYLTKATAKIKWKKKEGIITSASILVTIVLLMLILVFVGYLVIPEVVSSASSLISYISTNLPKWIKDLESMNIDMSIVADRLSSIDFNSINQFLTGSVGGFINQVSSTVMSTMGSMASFFISFTIAIYVLLDKKAITAKTKQIISAVVDDKIAEEFYRICSLVNRSLSNFFGGQSVEAFILGVAMFAAFTAFGLPYGSLIGFIAAIASFIPYIGATVANIIGSFLVFLVNPSLTILSIIVYQGVQFIESQFIYPKVVGKAVGISPLLTLTAVIVGSNLFGIIGIIFSIPITAVLYTLANEFIGKRLAEKNKEDIKEVKE